ncbi:MAG: hypothetical protein MJZ52_06385 [Bacteroidales bacterium]|nr:hypothetical protein [Bacteroidales bacterium]
MNETKVFLIDFLLAELINLIVQNKKVSFQDAIELLYNSKLYDKIMDIETGLYFQSADYNYELLSEEMTFNKN